MGTIPVVNSEQQGESSKSSKFSQDDDALALSRLMTKDPDLGQVMTMIMGKLDETNKKLGSFHNEVQGNLDGCQQQLNKLDARVKLVEDEQAATMEMVLKFKTELQDKKQQIIEDCLGLPTILRRILEQFSDKELTELSLVNKLWNFEARSVLRDRGCLKANITLESTCQNLVDFAADLRQMRVVPFTGISLRTSYSEGHCRSFPEGSLDPSYQEILDRLPWKHFSVEFPLKFLGRASQDCPAFLLVKKVLEKHCGVLEHLFFSQVCGNTDFLRTILQGRSFPCLKTFKVDNSVDASFAKALVSCAPNLEKFYIEGRIEFMENVMEGSSAKLVATSGFEIGRDIVCESLIGSLRTDTIAVHHSSDFDVELLNRIIPMIIEASRTTLKTLWMDLLFAVPLMCYGICLENVTELSIIISDSLTDNPPQILALLKSFDFTRTFPKLNQVKIMNWSEQGFSSDDVSAFIERVNAMARKALLDRAINIRHLELMGIDFPLSFFAEMFPHVKALSVEVGALHEFPFTLLWEQLGFLAEVHVKFHECDPSMTKHLDSVFCGIFPEEVAELRGKDDDYLKAVNIVPVMPSITCMRKLISFTFLDSSPRVQ